MEQVLLCLSCIIVQFELLGYYVLIKLFFNFVKDVKDENIDLGTSTIALKCVVFCKVLDFTV